MSIDEFSAMYLDWVNNFITVDAFAEHYGISTKTALKIIYLGREISDIELTK